MKKILAAGTIAFAIAPLMAGAANLSKVIVCHQTGSDTNQEVLIDISENALATHLASGDILGQTTDPTGACYLGSGGGPV